MSSFKVIKQADIRPKWCDYIQQKIDIAEKFNTVYELNDEDLRIQKLHEDTNLRNEEQVREVSRVRLPDGKQKLIISKRVNFYDNNTGAQKDSYIYTEGRTEEPIVTMNDKGEAVVLQKRLNYTIDFNGSKVDDYIKDGSGTQLSYFDAPMTSGRTEPNHILVGNLETFKSAKWEELLYGTELKNISSMINKLPETRRKMNGGGIDTTEGVQNVSPLTGQIGFATIHSAEINAALNHQNELGSAQLEAVNEGKSGIKRENDNIELAKTQAFEQVTNTQEQHRKVLKGEQTDLSKTESNKRQDDGKDNSKASTNSGNKQSSEQDDNKKSGKSSSK